ncbi:MAG TPA: hypothetical protein VKZ93_02875 [Arenibacter sp.]|nr:hypothetical protein [Arenibacter sp.]
MSQNLREMFKDIDSKLEHAIKDGHEGRFLERLEKEFPPVKKLAIPWFGIAASVVILMGIASYILVYMEPVEPIKTKVVDSNTVVPELNSISLGDLSPDLKRVENYYMVNINLELSRLEISDRNKVLIDSFMDQLEELNLEYKRLNKELNEIGPNDQTISALIKNLQLRLQLLHKLKDKLQELKTQLII